MKKQFVIGVLFMTVISFLAATDIKVEQGVPLPKNCKSIAKLKYGGLGSTTSIEIVVNSLKEAAQDVGANYLKLEISFIKHQKLGKRYYGRGIAASCR